MAFERKSGGESGHVLLRDSDVQELTWELGGELVQNTKAEIAGEQQKLRVLRSELGKHTDKSISHCWPSSSASAASNSSAARNPVMPKH